MSYIVSVHIPIAGLGLLPVVFGWPLLFFPVHVLFLEFVIDPACAFVFEADPESPDIMRRKPRRPDEPLFSRVMLRRGVLLGAVVLVFAAIVYGTALALMQERSARALTFFGLVISNLALIFVSRSRSENFGVIFARKNTIYSVDFGRRLPGIDHRDLRDLHRGSVQICTAAVAGRGDGGSLGSRAGSARRKMAAAGVAYHRQLTILIKKLCDWTETKSPRLSSARPAPSAGASQSRHGDPCQPTRDRGAAARSRPCRGIAASPDSGPARTGSRHRSSSDRSHLDSP